VPASWVLPSGHWQFTSNTHGHPTGIPTAHGNNPAFINNPPGHTGLHVGNMPLASPSPSPSPAPTPAATPGPGQNPQTSPIRISLLIFGSVMTLGLAAFGMVSVARKQAVAAEAYRSKSARFDREKRLSDLLDDDK